MPFILLLLFVGVPLFELYILIQVGQSLGALPTILLCVLTAVLGAGLIRLQGLGTLMRARRNMEQGMAPALEMLEGVALALAGLLLLTPGFATDLFGFLLLLPPLRRTLIRRSLARMNVTVGPAWQQHRGQSGDKGRRTLEGDYERRD
ncbi:FxsA family protein [Natronospira bacteriovora]|uniref:FxsA family protein n=1 Tax=Natronospira bacteriovora TaxID=3069753 RepID=A0ABU0W4D8_9GAMM|nr:FxsA family protein [Natronospira sp. AB-CW4]MDQ2068885.1 FxsA family protein [Natronospira sp. AB-CW4]